MASVAAIGAALVPVLVNYPDVDKLYPTVVSLVVAAIVALDAVFRPREHWRNYDLISSVLREEEMRFSTKAAPYDGQDVEESFRTFVDHVEDAIAKERTETIAMRTTPAVRTDSTTAGKTPNNR
jgi:hypothetical protein